MCTRSILNRGCRQECLRLRGEGVAFHDNLCRLRKESGISRAEMAKILNITENAYGTYERGEREPRLEKLCKIADALETSVDALLGHYEGDSYVRKYFALKEKIEKLLEEE